MLAEKADTELISIHALREEGDAVHTNREADLRLFLSTPSARRATGGTLNFRGYKLFLSTPSARRATRGILNERVYSIISIHALREEGDADHVPPDRKD